MARLTNLKPGLSTLATSIGYIPDATGRDRHRDTVQPWRKWYKTSRWQKLRWSILIRDGLMCQMCKTIVPDTSKLVADHRTPHRGSASLFWDAANLWALCKDCHDGAKQREERGR